MDNPAAAWTNMIDSVRIGNGVTSIGSYVFYNCYSLASITIPSSVTSFGEYAFENCSSLASINIPSSVTSIGINGFRGCKSLASITIPNSVTKFSNSAFYGCYSLASITIPSSVTKIEGLTFQNCYGLKTYDFRTATAVPTLDNANAFSNTPSDKEIIVPDELYDTWITAGNWSSINGIVKASESSLGSLS